MIEDISTAMLTAAVTTLLTNGQRLAKGQETIQEQNRNLHGKFVLKRKLVLSEKV